jgi:uncharacterized integral membrane protein
MATLYLIIALVISAIAVVFALQNTMTVVISFLTWQITGSLSLVLLATLAIGILIGLLVLAPSMLSHAITASSQRKRILTLEKELSDKQSRIAELQKPSSIIPTPEVDPRQ